MNRNPAWRGEGVTAPPFEDRDTKQSSRTLRDEWHTFAGQRECSTEAPVGVLRLPQESHNKLIAHDVTSLNALLDWTWSQLGECLGNEEAERALDVLVEAASQERLKRRVWPPHEWPGSEDIARLVQARWTKVPIAELGLAQETLYLLTNDEPHHLAADLRLSDVLVALDDSSASLFWDLGAYADAWDKVVQLGFHQGDALAHRLTCLREDGPSLSDALENSRSACTDSEWKVMCERFGLEIGEKRRTLQQISERWGVSRERVRQVETAAFKKLRREPTFISLARSTRFLIERAGGVLSLEDAGEELDMHFEAADIPSSHICRCLLDAFDGVQKVTRTDTGELEGTRAPTTGPIYALKECAASFPVVIATARDLWRQRKTSIESDHWMDMVNGELRSTGHEINPAFVRACLRADGRFDPDDFDCVDIRRNLEDALVEALQRHGAPAHYTLLTQKVNEFGVWGREATDRSVHGRLGAHPQLFVCIGRGIYGLLAWGLEEQRKTRDTVVPIADLIEEFLEAEGEPRSAKEIVNYVLARKRSHDYSVLQRLQGDPKFYRFTKGVYGLKKWIF
ncbi:RNA polymerase sigma factor RpoD (plasmid) [Abditibacteriota bacterium]|nr:RNA polymerase sigma factor RpoD [Abditibacteriota bacterium]